MDVSFISKFKKSVGAFNYQKILFYKSADESDKNEQVYVVCKNGYTVDYINGNEQLSLNGKYIPELRWKSALNDIGVKHFTEISDDDIKVFEMIII